MVPGHVHHRIVSIFQTQAKRPASAFHAFSEKDIEGLSVKIVLKLFPVDPACLTSLDLDSEVQRLHVWAPVVQLGS